LTQELLLLGHRSEEPGDEIFSPHLQVQVDIKMTYQKTTALLLFPHLAKLAIPLPSIKLFYLISSKRSAWILSPRT
jgi:hypothetical protein